MKEFHCKVAEKCKIKGFKIRNVGSTVQKGKFFFTRLEALVVKVPVLFIHLPHVLKQLSFLSSLN